MVGWNEVGHHDATSLLKLVRLLLYCSKHYIGVFYWYRIFFV